MYFVTKCLCAQEYLNWTNKQAKNAIFAYKSTHNL
jgi:hypothetical protein